ncbi:MAG: hypothetical protein Q9168_008377 [Polycauliona sp. 1 TL-2023]
MASDVLPPNPCLLAILLVVKINSEPKIVFHYPPRPGQDNTHFARYLAAQDKDQDGSSSTDDDSPSSQDEDSQYKSKSKDSKTGDNTPELDVEETGSVSPEKNDIWRDQYGKPKWSDLFGLGSHGLAQLLCPPPTSHKQRFEMSIDDKVFVGRPIFAQEGVDWQKKKEERKRRDRKSGTDSEITGVQMRATASEDLDSSAQETDNSIEVSDFADTSGDGLEIRKEASADQHLVNGKDKFTEEQGKPKKKDSLNMFHVVFVLDPPPLEHHLRVKEMYDHVIKKFSKILKREQAHSSYVLREISAMFKDTPKMKGAHSKITSNTFA